MPKFIESSFFRNCRSERRRFLCLIENSIENSNFFGSSRKEFCNIWYFLSIGIAVFITLQINIRRCSWMMIRVRTWIRVFSTFACLVGKFFLFIVRSSLKKISFSFSSPIRVPSLKIPLEEKIDQILLKKFFSFLAEERRF